MASGWTILGSGEPTVNGHYSEDGVFDGGMDEVRINSSNIFSATPVVGVTDGFIPPTYLVGYGKQFQTIVF